MKPDEEEISRAAALGLDISHGGRALRYLPEAEARSNVIRARFRTAEPEFVAGLGAARGRGGRPAPPKGRAMRWRR
jgi:hypothetical protein